MAIYARFAYLPNLIYFRAIIVIRFTELRFHTNGREGKRALPSCCLLRFGSGLLAEYKQFILFFLKIEADVHAKRNGLSVRNQIDMFLIGCFANVQKHHSTLA